ncbi:DUF2779 domain-containing protein [Alcaligenaceae bacterium]|nr:DUF2779 domain-containing protein [Alcaligenaceae bacterium]
MLPTMEKTLLAIVDRMVDLLPITREHYYHPDIRGSFSIKAVLPTIAPNLTYDGLEQVQDGGMAQQVWLVLVQGDLRSELRQGLLDYCERDTYGLVVLADFLQAN